MVWPTVGLAQHLGMKSYRECTDICCERITGSFFLEFIDVMCQAAQLTNLISAVLKANQTSSFQNS